MKRCWASIGFAIALFLSIPTTGVAQPPTLSLEAVKINGVAIANSNSITVNSGDIIEAEIFASDWSPNGEQLVAFQASIDRASFVSGGSGTVKPLGWDRPLDVGDDIGCATDADCPAEWPICDRGICVGLEYDSGRGVFIVENRPDWVFFCADTGQPCGAFAVTDVSGVSIRFAGVVLAPSDASAYSLPPRYCGSLSLEVSGSASGTFAFEIEPSSSSLTAVDTLPIEPLTLAGLSIEVIPCGNGVVDAGEQCDDDGESATCDIDCTPAECGDGTLNVTAGEACDDGAGNSDTVSDACRTDCTLPGCGDGVIDAGEPCDDGGESAGCDVDCTVAECGDGVLNVSAGEECDGTELGVCQDSCDLDCTCPDEPIPTVSEWGLVILALMLLVTGHTYFGRRGRKTAA